LLKREVPMDDAYDVVVAGGGPGGCGAAICAAREGARVLLLEATGSLGGMGTSALVANWSALCTGERTVLGGIMREIIDTMHQRGNLPPQVTPDSWLKHFPGGTGFDPEGLKRLLDDLCIDAGVEIRFFTRMIDAEVDRDEKRIDGVIAQNVEGYRFIPAKAFVDATGDAFLADLCGAECREAGRDTRHIMPPTLCAVQTSIDWDAFAFEEHQSAVMKAIEDGFFSQPDRHVPGIFRTGKQRAIMNAGHLFKTNALNCRSLSDAMIRGRKLATEYSEFYRRYLPDACKDMEMGATGSLLGVRESRRIVGEYELNYEDFKARRHFDDDIAIYMKQVDIHVYDCTEEEYERYYEEFSEKDTLGFGESYGLPYRMIVPKGWQNLWVAGRCNSSDIKVNGAMRDQPACYMLGQAAGTAAAQAINTGQTAVNLDTTRLVKTLRSRGAELM